MKYCPLCETSYEDDAEVCPLDGATLHDSRPKRDTLTGKVIRRRYRVLEKLGEGGMGTVYLAEQVAISRKVALKILHPDYTADQEFVRRFRQEAKLAASFSHRNVVTVFDFDQADDGSLYIVMEYVDGDSLADVIRKGPMEIDRALQLATQVADGLNAAHRAGVIHRDVKPENIMVVGGGQEIKLMDFGIARLRDTGTRSRLTRSGTIMGTPAYMAPEQIEGGEVSERTDIYAFGIVLYEMLSGNVPFKAPTPGAVLIKHLQEQPVPLRKLRKEVSPLIERVVIQALQKDPANRQARMEEIVEALKRAQLEGFRRSAQATGRARGAWARARDLIGSLSMRSIRPKTTLPVSDKRSGQQDHVAQDEARDKLAVSPKPSAVGQENLIPAQTQAHDDAEKVSPSAIAGAATSPKPVPAPYAGAEPTRVLEQPPGMTVGDIDSTPEAGRETVLAPAPAHQALDATVVDQRVARDETQAINRTSQNAEIENSTSTNIEQDSNRIKSEKNALDNLAASAELVAQRGWGSRKSEPGAETVIETVVQRPPVNDIHSDQRINETAVSTVSIRESPDVTAAPANPVAQTAAVQLKGRANTTAVEPMPSLDLPLADHVIERTIATSQGTSAPEVAAREPIADTAMLDAPRTAPSGTIVDEVEGLSLGSTQESDLKPFAGVGATPRLSSEPLPTIESVDAAVFEPSFPGQKPFSPLGENDAASAPSLKLDETREAQFAGSATTVLSSTEVEKTTVLPGTAPKRAFNPKWVAAAVVAAGLAAAVFYQVSRQTPTERATPVNLVSLTVSGIPSELKVNDRVRLTVHGRYSDGKEVNNPGNVRWESSDPNIAGVNTRGELEGRAAGSAQITAKYEGASKSYGVTVKADSPEEPGNTMKDILRRGLR